jgi:hypothetical protein
MEQVTGKSRGGKGVGPWLCMAAVLLCVGWCIYDIWSSSTQTKLLTAKNACVFSKLVISGHVEGEPTSVIISRKADISYLTDCYRKSPSQVTGGGFSFTGRVWLRGAGSFRAYFSIPAELNRIVVEKAAFMDLQDPVHFPIVLQLPIPIALSNDLRRVVPFKN